MAGLKEIARESGTSIRTVSRALKGNGYVNADLKARILDVAEQLNYRPNRIARSLKNRCSYEICVLTNTTFELAMEKIVALEKAMREHGYSVSILYEAEINYEPEKIFNMVMEHCPAGVAFINFNICETLLNCFRDQRIPYVTIDNKNSDFNVAIARDQGVYEAVNYLYQNGHRQIAYMGWHDEGSRLTGYCRAIKELGLKEQIIDIAGGEGRYQEGQFIAGRNGFQQYYECVDKPSAILTFTDIVALGFIDAAHKHNVRIPDDVSVVGFDNQRSAEFSSPPLTTVAQPNKAVGEMTAELLLEQINGKQIPEGGLKRICETTLIIRESTEKK